MKAKRKFVFLTISVILTLLCFWWLMAPNFITLNVSLAPQETGWGYKNYTVVEEQQQNGGGKYYVTRFDGVARESDGWSKDKVFQHIEESLSKDGWKKVGERAE